MTLIFMVQFAHFERKRAVPSGGRGDVLVSNVIIKKIIQNCLKQNDLARM